MADTTFSVDDIVGQQLTSKVNLNSRTYASTSAPVYAKFGPGVFVGIVDGWIIGKDGKIWWQFYDSKGKPYYVQNNVGYFDVGTLKDAGVKTVKEKTEEKAKADLTFLDKLALQAESFVTILKWVIIAGLIIYVLIEINKHYPLTQILHVKK